MSAASTLPALLQRNVAERSASVALRHKSLGIWRTWSWRQVAAEVTAVRRGLTAKGFVSGDALVVLDGHRPSTLFAVLAAQAVGGVVSVPSADALAATLADERSAVVLVDDQEQLEQVLAVTVTRRRPLHLVVTGVGIEWGGTSGVESFDHFVADHREAASGDDASGPKFSMTAFVYPDGTTAPLQLDHARLAQAAEDSRLAHAVTERDEVLAAESLLRLPGVHLGLAQWLASGYRLNLPEAADTVDVDRREIGPTYAFGSAGTFDRLVQGIGPRLGAADSRRRQRIERILARGARAGGAGPVALLRRWLLLRPLRDVLGLSRVRLVVVSDLELQPGTVRVLQALGVPLKLFGDANDTRGVIVTEIDHPSRPATVLRHVDTSIAATVVPSTS
ncbi:MAG: AMP-binding protein [Burkholderiales bacterium]|nr:AMP-binding protein [Burkholderiales bacterium]